MTQVTLTITDEMIEAGFCTGMPEAFDIVFNKDTLDKLVTAKSMMTQFGKSSIHSESYLHLNDCFDVPVYKGDISDDLVYINTSGEINAKFFTDGGNEQIDVCIDDAVMAWWRSN